MNASRWDNTTQETVYWVNFLWLSPKFCTQSNIAFRAVKSGLFHPETAGDRPHFQPDPVNFPGNPQRSNFPAFYACGPSPERIFATPSPVELPSYVALQWRHLAKYLITGAAGFIGSHIASALVVRGESVVGFDNLSTGVFTNLDPIRSAIDFRHADLCDPAAVAAACEGVDTIFHEAALPSVPRSVEQPRPSHEANLDGTFNLLVAAKEAGVRRVVYAASSSAYGNQPGFPRVETMAPQPLSPYAVQKLAGEYYLQSFHRVYGMETVCLRYFNVFGPRQVPNSQYSGVIAKFALQMLEGVTPTIFGDGQQGRDFTYIDNVVEANLLAATAPAAACAGRVFNIACGERHTLLETYSVLAELIEFPHPPNHGPVRNGDVTDSFADITAASDALGFTPSIGFREGLSRTIDWYRETWAPKVLAGGRA